MGRLEMVLRYKAGVEDEALRHLAGALREHASSLEALTAARASLEAIGAAGARTVDDLHLAELAAWRAQADVQRATERLAAAEAHVDRTRELHRQRATERRALARVVERRDEEARRAEDHRHQRLLDEVAARRHRRRTP